MKTTTLYLLLILGCVLNGSSQQLDVNKFSLLDMRQGLTNNQVNDIIQDSFGFIWIATKKGLNRYDGNYFMQFYADSNKNSLPEDYITKLTMLPGNVLAASTTTGLFTINTKTLKSKTILIPADSLKYAYKVNVVMDVDADQNGNIYLLTRSGFYMMNAEGKILFRYDYYSAAEAVSKPFAFGYSLIKMNDDEYILSTAKGTLFYQAKKKTLTPITENKDPFLLKTIEPNIRFRTLFGNAESFIIMKDSVLILNYFNKIKRNYVEIKLSRAERENFDWRSKMFKLSDTLYAISGKENGFYFINYNKASQTFYFNSELQFEKYICKAVLKDREGRIWIGTNKGLFKEKIQSGIVEKISIPSTFKSDSTDLLFREVRLINDKIFVGGKGGLFVLDRKEGKTIKHFDFKRINPSSNIIWSLLALNRDTLFIGTYGPLIIFNPNTYSYKEGVLPGWDSFDWVSFIHKDTEGNLFLASEKEGKIYIRLNGQPDFEIESHKSNPLFDILTVRNMVTDNENNTWLCGHGMSRYNLQKRAIDIKMDSFPTMKIPRKEVLSLVFDANGVMYFGLAENGLIIYDPSSKKFEQLSRSNGLPDNNILALYLIQKTLWIGTASGLATYNIDTKKIVSYGNMNEDNPEEYFTGFSFYFDSTHNQLYAPFSNSVLRFDPFNFKKNNSAPSFFIENIRINEKDIIYHPSGYINLQPGENNLVVSLASINYSNAFEEQYYYRFKKNETTAWQYAGTQKNFILSNLSAGNHEIEFMVASKINSWTPQVIDLHIHIRPPFWRSAWFIIIASLLLLTTIFLLYKARVNRIKQRANIDNELAELEMKSLHAQMNPHFIFNALNSIKEMIWDDDKSNASRYLSKFAQLIRTTLEQSSQSFISVKQCVLHLEQYLEMERIRFDDFTFSIAMDENMEWDNRKMAPMLVQPLVENAIWHGLKNTTGDKVLEIKFYEEEHHVVCEISDNGPGINHVEKPGKIAATHRSIGITNIHNRLQMLNEKYHMNCSLSFIDKADKDENLHGTIAILRLSF